MGKSTPPKQVAQEVWNALRQCQQEGASVGLAYASVKTPNQNPRACLISLPTGAGKTGLIAVLSHYTRQKTVLVLCHRAAVREQLQNELNGKFFKEKVENFLSVPKTVHTDIGDEIATGIYVLTFQKLRMLKEQQLKILKEKVDLIIVDEGHSEPAPVWSSLVRGSGARKIIITATPYRNDLFSFDIDPDWNYIYTFAQGVVDEVISAPRFLSVDGGSIVNAVRANLESHPFTKCIVKCRDFNAVRSYLHLFLEAGINALAIHDNYSGATSKNEKASVPVGLADSGYDVIVHQHKLDEGVDLPSAKLLVLTYVVTSGRELVQAIGRVVRSYKEVAPIVFDLMKGANEKIWGNYRAFDMSLNDKESVRRFVRSLNSAEIVRNYLDVFPDYGYAEGAFVKRFNFNEVDVSRSLMIPTASVCFSYVKDDFDIDVAMDILYWKASAAGELARIVHHGDDLRVLLSVAFSRSKFLVDEFFFEPKLEVLVVGKLDNKCAAIYDSRSRTFSGDEELRTGAAIPQDKLLKIMAVDKATKTKETSSKAISSTLNRPEVIVQKGPELERVGNSQENGARRISTIRFDNFTESGVKSGSFYVGMDNGRVSDQKQSKFSLNDLGEWFEFINSKFHSAIEQKNPLVESYASAVDFDENRKIHSVIVDFSEYSAPIEVRYRGNAYVLDNSFLYFSYADGLFLLAAPDSPIVRIEWEAEAPFLSLSCSDDVSWLIVSAAGTQTYDGISFLIDHVSKVLLDDGVGYSGGHFYKLTLPVRKGFDIDNSVLAGIITSHTELLNPLLDEKGVVNDIIEVADDEFNPNSIFNLIDRLKGKASRDCKLADLGPFYDFISGVDLMVCTDMDTEPADFIVSSPTKLVFLHVKCGDAKKPMSSAGALAEVGSQAVKNLEMLISPVPELRPGNWNTLLTKWPRVNAPKLLRDRIRLFEGLRYKNDDPSKLEEHLVGVWDVISRRRTDTRVRKEVWVISGNGFSLSHFKSQLSRGPACMAESLQAFQLIQSWVATAQSNDVTFRIFAAP